MTSLTTTSEFPGHLATVVAYGHLGDGNLHLNISASQYDDAVSSRTTLLYPWQIFYIIYIIWLRGTYFQILARIEPFVYEWTSKNRGSISAEHGLGLMKANKIMYSKSQATVSLNIFILLPVYVQCFDWQEASSNL